MPPIVIAHRTCPRDAPENSIAGILQAAELGADVVEVDVRLTADGVPILMHDRTVRRTTGVRKRTASITDADRSRLRLVNGETVPTLAEALAALPVGLRMAIEVKAEEAVDPTLHIVFDQQRQDDVMLWSQHESCIRAVAIRAANIETALLRDTHTRLGHHRYFRAARRCGADAISARWQAVDAGFAARARGHGLILYSWCQTPPTDLDRLALIDGVVTDWPADARTAIAAVASRTDH
jgi:glycerophosphoryl diester phosphodiesterase